VDRDSPKCFQGYQSSCCKPRMINCDWPHNTWNE
jgi:hypothetical protein